MGTAVEQNLAEVTKDELIRAEMEKIEAKDAERIRAEAVAVVEAKLAAEEAARLELEAAEANANAQAEAAKARAATLKSFANGVAKFMIDNGIDNPRNLTDGQIDAIRAKAGL